MFDYYRLLFSITLDGSYDEATKLVLKIAVNVSKFSRKVDIIFV